MVCEAKDSEIECPESSEEGFWGKNVEKTEKLLKKD